MINNFKFAEGEEVVVTSISKTNVENLQLFGRYTIVGATQYGSDVVYQMKNKDGDMRYANEIFLTGVAKKAPSIEDIVDNKITTGYDVVNKPKHYQGKVECIDAIESAVEGLEGLEAVCTANAIKYLYRWKAKNGVEDCKKAKWYLEKLINRLEEK